MLIDHTGAAVVYTIISTNRLRLSDPDLWQNLTTLYRFMRQVGRLAFPIYCFLIVEGFFHTRSVRKYCERMFLFALVSEFPFDYALKASVPFWRKQNVFFTLFIGLLVVHAMDSIAAQGGAESVRKGSGKIRQLPALYFAFCNAGLVCAAAALAYFMKTDYNAVGVLAVCAMYLLRRFPIGRIVGTCVILLASSVREVFALGAVLPISLYNGQRGRQLKYFFYLAYPVHLMILWLLRIPFGI